MATNRHSIFIGSALQLGDLHSNLDVLQQTSMHDYLLQFPNAKTMLAILEEKGVFKAKGVIEGNISDFLKKIRTPPHALTMTPIQLLASSIDLSLHKIPLEKLIEIEPEPLPEIYRALTEEVACYIDLIIDVLNNELAKKPYEKIQDQENVTEKGHGLQAGKMAFLFGLQLDDILGMLLHDIARPSINSAEHGHMNHGEEGSVILAPLGFTTDYTKSHTFAKYLLNECCPPYQRLISRASIYTLEIQKKRLAFDADFLKGLDPEIVPLTLYKLMFLRLIDDMSKVPESLIKQSMLDQKPEYFSDMHIRKMLVKQMITHLKTMPGTPANLSLMKDKLHGAFELLLRAKTYSLNPTLYITHEPILGSDKIAVSKP